MLNQLSQVFFVYYDVNSSQKYPKAAFCSIQKSLSIPFQPFPMNTSSFQSLSMTGSTHSYSMNVRNSPFKEESSHSGPAPRLTHTHTFSVEPAVIGKTISFKAFIYSLILIKHRHNSEDSSRMTS